MSPLLWLTVVGSPASLADAVSANFGQAATPALSTLLSRGAQRGHQRPLQPTLSEETFDLRHHMANCLRCWGIYCLDDNFPHFRGMTVAFTPLLCKSSFSASSTVFCVSASATPNFEVIPVIKLLKALELRRFAVGFSSHLTVPGGDQKPTFARKAIYPQ